MNKIFWIYFSAPGALDYPLNKKVFFESYAEIIENLEKRSIDTVIVRNNSYLWNWEFSHYFKWDGTTYEKIDTPIKLDLLWNRDSENTIPHIDDLEVLNRFEFDEICRDKVKTYENFTAFSWKTIIINSYKELEENIWKISSDRIILKPRFWEQCMWVYAINKDEINADLYEDWDNILLQEFLDSSVWIEWLVDWLHEIQVFSINGVFSWARLKQPAKWSLISSATGANIWTVRWLKEKEIPTQLLKEMKKLDDSISGYPLRLYRADFVHTNKWYKMIEINSRPGVMHKDKEWPEYYWDFNGNIINLIAWFLGK